MSVAILNRRAYVRYLYPLVAKYMADGHSTRASYVLARAELADTFTCADDIIETEIEKDREDAKTGITD